MQASMTHVSPKTGMAGPARLGALASVALLLSALIWMQVTLISSAVIAKGQIVVHGKPKQVQSFDGGVVDKIFVEEGELVKEGQKLLRLDSSLLEINLEIFQNRLAGVIARENRLEAEYLGLDNPVFSDEATSIKDEEIRRHITGQKEIFEARREVLAGRKEQLAERILQFENQISGVEGQIASKKDQLEFVKRDLENKRALNDQGLAKESQVLDLQRAVSALLGQISQHQSELARIRNSIRDTQLEILQADRQFKEEVVTELRETTLEHEELTLQIATARKQLERIEIVSPADGVVHEMKVFNSGAVVAPKTTILQVVPLTEGIDFEIRVEPRSIDQVHLGQIAKVSFPAFNKRTTPEIFGTVSGISPTSVVDERTGRNYFKVDLLLPKKELDKLGDLQLIPGMPVEAFLQTGERSVLNYLTKPLVDQLKRAFRES